MPQDRTPQLSFNLSRRLISIFLVSVLAVYTAGITVTLRLRRSAMQDWQAAYTAQAADFTDQLNTELLRIRIGSFSLLAAKATGYPSPGFPLFPKIGQAFSHRLQ